MTDLMIDSAARHATPAHEKTPEAAEGVLNDAYRYGFVTDIETDQAPPGLDESTVRFISAKKNEPDWLLDWRLKSFAAWQKMTPPALGAFAN